jgi:hypothetical protein
MGPWVVKYAGRRSRIGEMNRRDGEIGFGSATTALVVAASVKDTFFVHCYARMKAHVGSKDDTPGD